MIINHPLLGPRDAHEFTYLGDACLIGRPEWKGDDAMAQFHDYVYLRDDPEAFHRELWFHEYGDRSWLVVTRHTLTNEISAVEMANDMARKQGRSR